MQTKYLILLILFFFVFSIKIFPDRLPTAYITYDEKTLLILSSQGNEQAFTELFLNYKDKLFSFIYGITSSLEMAEDVIQDIFMRLWADRQKLADIENFGGYISRAGQNQIINTLKRFSKEVSIVSNICNQFSASEQNEVMDNLIYKELVQLLKNAVDKLPPQQKRVFKLSRESGHKIDDIATILNISPSTVNNHLVQALGNIRKSLKNELLIVFLWLFVTIVELP